MRTGLACGDERPRKRAAAAASGTRRAPGAPVLALFRDSEDGFTTVAVALALLLSLTLVFASASAGWVTARSSEVQRVADATALAGENAVAAFSTVAQVLDACVLSMGLAGVVTYGAGLVLSCVPGLTPEGARVCEAASRVLASRRDFAQSAAKGIERLEKTLPLLVVANSASCVAANGKEGLSYVGCALPFPAESQSDFSALEQDVDDARFEELAKDMRQASREVAEAKERADAALKRGWEADCGSEPYCLFERAAHLAGLSGADNPHYPTPTGWSFGAPLMRARAYYAARFSAERVEGSTTEELTDAACRKAFYAYALDEVRAGSYEEASDGSVRVDLPRLPKNAEETRATELYTQATWPCTSEDPGRTLHAAASCPGAQGASAGMASLAELDGGAVRRCGECQMDVGKLGRVAAASTSISNGFEHHWRIIVEASEEYEAAKNEQVAAEARSKELASKGEGLFSEAVEQLSVARPRLCPPGAWGTVAVVARGEGTAVPTELTRAFLSSAELPSGAAVSSAVLASDESTAENNVLSTFFDALGAQDSFLGGALDGVMELWGSLLVGYGSAYGDLADAGSRFLDGLDGVLGGTVGSWLKGKLKDVMHATGFEPVDMRLRKPVLTNTQDVLDQSGLDQVSSVRSMVARLPESGSAEDFARAMGLWLVDEVGTGTFTVAEITIPGTNISIPLAIDLSELGRAT